MPRNGKGGKRNGDPGTAYPQRTDLNTAMLNETAPAEGREFGAVARDEAALGEVPMGRPPVSPTGGRPPVPTPAPGQLTPLGAPSSRPEEPLTAGLSKGFGPGPEALATSPRRLGSNVLARIADETNDPYLRTLAGLAKNERG